MREITQYKKGARVSEPKSKLPDADPRSMLAKAGLGLRFNEHLEGDGPTVFAHVCKMGLEGKDSAYRSGRSPDWLKTEASKIARGARQ